MGRLGRIAEIRALYFGVGLFMFLVILWAPFQARAAALHNVNGWSWSGNTGWISMNCEDPKPGYPTGDCDAANGNYGVDIDETGNLSGWAWSTNSGWVCFGATCDGVAGVPVAGTPADDHYCPSHTPCALYDTGDGEVHGWAYIVSETDAPSSTYRGWISLNCTDVDPNTALPRDCGTSDYGVAFDESSGYFSGYAWNSNVDVTGDGWIQFACGASRPCGGLDWGVTSTWISGGWTAIQQQEGVYSPSPAPTTGSHLTTIPIVFENFSAPEDSTLRCVLMMSDGNYREMSWEITERISEQPEYAKAYTVTGADGVLDATGNPVLWSFSSEPPDPPFGCEIIGVPSIQKAVSNLMAIHPSTWEFTGPGGALGSDSNRAKFCLDGNLGALSPDRAYFLNSVQCDTEGDLAFTLLKAKGIEVEVYCSDDLDDDANLQADCAGAIPAPDPDRHCRGITYLCIPHPVAPSTDPPLP